MEFADALFDVDTIKYKLILNLCNFFNEPSPLPMNSFPP